jgi:hypothetical protein
MITVHPAPPATPRNTSNKSELWKHMLSSPIPPPSPVIDVSRYSRNLSRSKTAPSLEWACAKARVALKRDDHSGSARIFGSDRDINCTADVDMNVGDVFDTPSSSTIASTTGVGKSQKSQINAHPSEEVEAAMVLLGFMSQR